MRHLFGFIGAGNMGGALAKAASQSTKDILIADHFTQKAEALAERLGVNASENAEIAESCDYIFLGVKPQMMADMLEGIKDILKDREREVILVTMAAGLSIATIRAYAGADYKVIRIMPNTPVEVGEGEILYTKSENTSDEELNLFLETMKHAGELTPISEELMNAGCSLSGCGPAFVYLFIKALAQGGVDCGLDEETALKLACQTVRGSAVMLSSSPLSPDTLIQNVCSKGGSTIEGVKSLNEDRLEKIVRKALKASFERNIELGKLS